MDSLLKRGKTVEELKIQHEEVLISLENEIGHSQVYFKSQWERQRDQQLAAIGTPTQKELLKTIDELVDLEDKLEETKSVSMIFL